MHVRDQPHSRLRKVCSSLACEPRTVSRGLEDVFPLKLGILLDDVVRAVAVAQELEDEVDRDSETADRRLPLADTRVDSDSVQHREILACRLGPERQPSHVQRRHQFAGRTDPRCSAEVTDAH